MTALVLVTTLAIGQCFTLGLQQERWQEPPGLYRVAEFGVQRVRVHLWRWRSNEWSPDDGNLDVPNWWHVRKVPCPR